MSQPIYKVGPVKAPRPLKACCLAFWLFFSQFAYGQCPLVCKQNVQVSLSPEGDAPITVQMIAPSSWAACPDELSIKLFLNGKAIGDTLTCAHVGETVIARVRHTPSGNSCTGSLVLRDALSPQMACRDTTLLCVFPTDPTFAGEPEVTDNCTVQTLNYTDTEVNFPCGAQNNGIPVTSRLDRRWFASDQSNNTATCMQRIWVQQATLADVAFPENRDGIAKAALDCKQNASNLALTGEPTIAGKPIANYQACEIGATYSDSKINFCAPAGYSILRTWTVADFCGGNVIQRTQIIKVEDKKPPVLTLPAHLTFSTTPFACSGTVTLPQASATDDCSAVTITPNWEFGNGYGPFLNVPIGEYNVTYTAVDACGNQTTRPAKITVADLIPPQAVCAAALQISLSSSGSALLNAAMLDAGSLDNCSGIFLDFSLRNDSIFNFSDTLTCADIGTTLIAKLRVRDDAGFENFCDTKVNVHDFIRPMLACPPHITLSCLDNYKDSLLVGIAQAQDNCALDTLFFTEKVNLSGCNTGTVLRTWFAADVAGNTRTCTQQIFMSAVSNVQVEFPKDVLINACGVSADLKPTATGAPKISGTFCYPLSVTYKDEIFNISAPACFRVVRRWKVVDFCTYNPNNGSAGLWESGQIIDVRDSKAPTLSLPPDLTLSPDQPLCKALVNVQAVAYDDCSPSVTVVHDSPFAYFPGADCSGIYPVGEHSVTFTATDGCGNTARQTLRITVKDLTPPALKCLAALSLNVPPTRSIILQTNVLDAGAQDNCSPLGELAFSIQPAGFTCQDTGHHIVTMRVTDLSGNSATCSANVHVQDNNGACASARRHLDGRVLTRNGTPVNEARITLDGDGKQIVVSSDSTGHYAFPSVQSGYAYSIKGDIKEKSLNGVSTYDLVLISKHILGLEALNDHYRMIAADANRSNTITTLDIVVLRRLILGIDTAIINNSSWRFIPAKHVFSDPDNPFANNGFPNEIPLNLTFNSTDTSGHDFVGIKVGDVNGSADAADPRSLPDTSFVVLENARLAANQPIAIPVYLPNWADLEGFQFELALDTTLATLQHLTYPQAQLLSATHVNHRKNGAGLALSWNKPLQNTALQNDAPAVVLHLLPKENTTLDALLSLSKNELPAESYFIEKEGVAPIFLQINTKQTVQQATENLLPRPNPFRNATYLPFRAKAAGEASLQVFDAQGRLVFAEKQWLESGLQQWPLLRNELAGSGFYTYRIVTNESAATGRVLLVE